MTNIDELFLVTLRIRTDSGPNRSARSDFFFTSIRENARRYPLDTAISEMNQLQLEYKAHVFFVEKI